jgi:hypothetical protein
MHKKSFSYENKSNPDEQVKTEVRNIPMCECFFIHENGSYYFCFAFSPYRSGGENPDKINAQ